MRKNTHTSQAGQVVRLALVQHPTHLRTEKGAGKHTHTSQAGLVVRLALVQHTTHLGTTKGTG